MKTQAILEQGARQANWDDADMLAVCEEYIEHQCAPNTFNDFVRDAASQDKGDN